MNIVDRNKVLSRIKEIEEEDKATLKPILGATSIEDVDDLYQARLEYNWWFDELNTEYKELCAQLGKLDAHLHRNQYQCQRVEDDDQKSHIPYQHYQNRNFCVRSEK